MTRRLSRAHVRAMTILREKKTWRRIKLSPQSVQPNVLTDEEQANIRSALLFLRIRVGGMKNLADLLKVNAKLLANHASPKRSTSVGLALRLARLAGVPLDDVLSGAWPPADACPACGRCDLGLHRCRELAA